MITWVEAVDNALTRVPIRRVAVLSEAIKKEVILGWKQ